MTDISTCAPVPNAITGPVACKSASHEVFLRSKIAGYLRAYQLRFQNDRRLSFYASYNQTPTTRVLAKFHLAPSGDALESQVYLALGDSFSSGEGAYDYFPETDTVANMCHLSKQSYPYLIGQQLSLGTHNSVACSGARIQDITSYAQKQNLPSPNNMGRLLPGYKKQLQYVHDQNPEVITVGIGGNDIGFGAILKRCVGNSLSVSTCYDSYEDRLELVRQINKQFDRLVDAFTQLRLAAKPGAKIYVAGYPQIAKANGNCAANVRLNNQEIILSRQVIDYLNRVIELSANKAGVRYVDVAEAFDGYKLCETDGKQTAMNGLTAGTDKLSLIGNESYHPNRLGHQLYKNKILAQTAGFLQSMPSPNAALKAPDETGQELLVVPKTNRPINEVIYDDKITDSTLDKRQTVKLQTSQGEYYLEPNATYRVELHSNPINLGTFVADSNGKLQANFSLPDDIASGFHSLHILGKNILGDNVDIYKTVYIPGQSEEPQVASRVSAGSSASKAAPIYSSSNQDRQGVASSNRHVAGRSTGVAERVLDFYYRREAVVAIAGLAILTGLSLLVYQLNKRR